MTEERLVEKLAEAFRTGAPVGAAEWTVGSLSGDNKIYLTHNSYLYPTFIVTVERVR